MKRSSVQILDSTQPQLRTYANYCPQDTSLLKLNSRKAYKFSTTRKAPPLLLADNASNKVTDDSLATIIDILYSRDKEDEDMIIDEPRISSIIFVFFLGVQGKEYIPEIQKIDHSSHFIFITSITTKSASISDNLQCTRLARNFNVIDPLGGGVYPLDYLFVIDSNGFIRSAISLIIGKRHLARVKKLKSGELMKSALGLDINQVPSFIEEYWGYFMVDF